VRQWIRKRSGWPSLIPFHDRFSQYVVYELPDALPFSRHRICFGFGVLSLAWASAGRGSSREFQGAFRPFAALPGVSSGGRGLAIGVASVMRRGRAATLNALVVAQFGSDGNHSGHTQTRTYGTCLGCILSARDRRCKVQEGFHQVNSLGCSIDKSVLRCVVLRCVVATMTSEARSEVFPGPNLIFQGPRRCSSRRDPHPQISQRSSQRTRMNSFHAASTSSNPTPQ